MNCPSEDVLLRFALGELSVRDASELERHHRACASCRSQLRDCEQLIADLSGAPRLALSAEAFTARVLAACAESSAAPLAAPPPRARGRAWLSLNALAAVVLLSILPWSPARDGSQEQFTARGSRRAQQQTLPRADVWLVREGAARTLAGAELRRGDGLAVRCSNPGDRPAYLAVFAVDAAGTAHWVYPAYLDVQSDPQSIEIGARVRDRTLEDVVEPDAPAPGALSVFALFSERPIRVREIEAALAREPAPDFHSVEQFGTMHLQQWSATWIAD